MSDSKATATARAANDFNRLFPDWTLLDALDVDYLDDTPEPEPVNAEGLTTAERQALNAFMFDFYYG